eukprot:271466-Pyramimonas_sp.AAC.1
MTTEKDSIRFRFDSTTLIPPTISRSLSSPQSYPDHTSSSTRPTPFLAVIVRPSGWDSTLPILILHHSCFISQVMVGSLELFFVDSLWGPFPMTLRSDSGRKRGI